MNRFVMGWRQATWVADGLPINVIRTQLTAVRQWTALIVSSSLVVSVRLCLTANDVIKRRQGGAHVMTLCRGCGGCGGGDGRIMS